MLRAIFFDAGNTLVRMNYEVIARELGRQGVVVDPVDLQRADWRARVRLDTEVLAATSGRVSTEDRTAAERYLEYLLAAAGVTESRVVRAVADWRRTYNVPVGVWDTVEPGAEAALVAARRAGLVTAVISNSNGSIRGILQALRLAPHFDFVLDSSEVGVEKPDPRLFRLALERAGVAPGEAAYVGDLYSIDVLGARAAGMDAILLDPGACWGARDCRTASDVLEAVHALLAP
ncbi:MAG: HAD-IA family hydrolase [Candidatus Rokubacteria bacterium]|nr:HAD-IA family hydrolase [Candidatus Rokubacteria bacterium]MBI3826028.1 HAD-IA family hydrolase [Candidatus Rokubacteria bacterium]